MKKFKKVISILICLSNTFVPRMSALDGDKSAETKKEKSDKSNYLEKAKIICPVLGLV